MIPEIKKILYATDLSPNSAHAFRYAIKFSKDFKAKVIILHVVKELSEDALITLEAYLGKERRKEFMANRHALRIERIRHRLQVFCDKEFKNDPACAESVASVEVCQGFPEEEILKKADSLQCDAIVMGAHEKGANHTFLGTVAKRVLRRSRKPVFIIPLPKGETDLTFHDE
jgi:nucleotide-binding universal stress UspA family protein